MKHKLLFILSILLLSAPAAHAEKIILTSGLFFNGEIKNVTADSITIQPKFGKLTEYPWDKVKSIDGVPAADFRSQHSSPSSAEPSPATTAEPEVERIIAPEAMENPILKKSAPTAEKVVTPQPKSEPPVEEKTEPVNPEPEETPPATPAAATENPEPAPDANPIISEEEKAWNNWRMQTREYYVSIEKLVEEANNNFESLRLQGISASSEEVIIDAINKFRQILQQQILAVKTLTPPTELQDYHKLLTDHLEFMDRSQEELLTGNIDAANKFLQLSRESYVQSKQKLRDVFKAQGAPKDVIEQMDVVLGEYTDALQAEQQK